MSVVQTVVTCMDKNIKDKSRCGVFNGIVCFRPVLAPTLAHFTIALHLLPLPAYAAAEG
jgi:hypothetical protein